MRQYLAPGTCDPPAELQPARIQLIQKLFPELIGDGDHWSRSADLGRSPRETLQWIHDRLFLEGWQVAAVRAELVRARQSVRSIAVTSGKGGVGKTTF
jgi:Mrp family chromosome partitioning ATPase